MHALYAIDVLSCPTTVPDAVSVSGRSPRPDYPIAGGRHSALHAHYAGTTHGHDRASQTGHPLWLSFSLSGSLTGVTLLCSPHATVPHVRGCVRHRRTPQHFQVSTADTTAAMLTSSIEGLQLPLQPQQILSSDYTSASPYIVQEDGGNHRGKIASPSLQKSNDTHRGNDDDDDDDRTGARQPSPTESGVSHRTRRVSRGDTLALSALPSAPSAATPAAHKERSWFTNQSPTTPSESTMTTLGVVATHLPTVALLAIAGTMPSVYLLLLQPGTSVRKTAPKLIYHVSVRRVSACMALVMADPYARCFYLWPTQLTRVQPGDDEYDGAEAALRCCGRRIDLSAGCGALPYNRNAYDSHDAAEDADGSTATMSRVCLRVVPVPSRRGAVATTPPPRLIRSVQSLLADTFDTGFCRPSALFGPQGHTRQVARTSRAGADGRQIDVVLLSRAGRVILAVPAAARGAATWYVCYYPIHPSCPPAASSESVRDAAGGHDGDARRVCCAVWASRARRSDAMHCVPRDIRAHTAPCERTVRWLGQSSNGRVLLCTAGDGARSDTLWLVALYDAPHPTARCARVCLPGAAGSEVGDVCFLHTRSGAGFLLLRLLSATAVTQAQAEAQAGGTGWELWFVPLSGAAGVRVLAVGGGRVWGGRNVAAGRGGGGEKGRLAGAVAVRDEWGQDSVWLAIRVGVVLVGRLVQPSASQQWFGDCLAPAVRQGGGRWSVLVRVCASLHRLLEWTALCGLSDAVVGSGREGGAGCLREEEEEEDVSVSAEAAERRHGTTRWLEDILLRPPTHPSTVSTDDVPPARADATFSLLVELAHGLGSALLPCGAATRPHTAVLSACLLTLCLTAADVLREVYIPRTPHRVDDVVRRVGNYYALMTALRRAWGALWRCESHDDRRRAAAAAAAAGSSARCAVCALCRCVPCAGGGGARDADADADTPSSVGHRLWRVLLAPIFDDAYAAWTMAAAAEGDFLLPYCSAALRDTIAAGQRWRRVEAERRHGSAGATTRRDDGSPLARVCRRGDGSVRQRPHTARSVRPTTASPPGSRGGGGGGGDLWEADTTTITTRTERGEVVRSLPDVLHRLAAAEAAMAAKGDAYDAAGSGRDGATAAEEGRRVSETDMYWAARRLFYQAGPLAAARFVERCEKANLHRAAAKALLGEYTEVQQRLKALTGV